MKKNNLKVDGVVVLYNPDESIISNIMSYINQLNKLYVVDNSESINSGLIDKILAISSKCIYVSNNGNKGIANALNKGALSAIENGSQWLLTMDQDSIFQEDNFVRLLEFTEGVDAKEIGLVSPFHQSVLRSKHEDIVEEVLLTMTSGNLISLYAYEKIGGFDERFFIDAVDWDYCIRLNLNGLKVLRVNTVFLKHELGNNARKIKTIFGKERVIQNYNYIRRYYITRNKLLIAHLYHKEYSKLSFRWRVSILADVRNILLYEQHKLSKMREILRGIKDYMRGKFYER